MKKFVLVLLSILSFMIQTKGPQTPTENDIPFISAGGRLSQQQIIPTQQQNNQYRDHTTSSSLQRKKDEREKQRSCLSCLCCVWSWKK